MTVAVTGAAGASGRVVAHHLQACGFEVLGIDREKGAVSTIAHRVADLCDYDQAYRALEGCAAVVHFGADPHPDTEHRSAAARFANNTVSTFNVFNAAIARGIPRVVWASSETVYGYPFEGNRPAAIPLSDAATAPQTAYAMSKLVCEHLAKLLCQINPGLTMIGLRISNILYAGTPEGGEQASNRLRDTYDRLPEYWQDPDARRFNLWNYIDVRDVAEAVRTSLSAPLVGAYAFPLTADDTIMDRPTRVLVEAAFPGVPVSGDLPEHGATVDTHSTRAVLGFTPHWSWRQILQEPGA